MKKLLMTLACCVTLAGCGGKGETVVQMESTTQEETISIKNLYEAENLVTKTIGDIEYQIPGSWGESEKINGDYIYYYDEGMMIMVYVQKMDEVKPFEEFPDNEKQRYKNALLDGMKSGFESYEEIDNSIHTSNNGVCMFRYQANVELQGNKYILDMLVTGGDGKVHEIGILVSPDSVKDYKKEFESLRKSIKSTSAMEETNEADNSNNSAINSLKELYKKESETIPYSEENSNSCFEVVLKSSKELAKRGDNASAEDFANDILFNPFAKSAGYLCNNYDEDTEYGKVGNMAFDLIGYIVADDNENRDNILEKFDAIANEHGMEIITVDDSENNVLDEIENETEPQESIDLSTGEYIVGEDIPAGKYDIVGIKRGYLSVCSAGKDYGDILGEIIEAGETVYSNARLENGQTLKVESGGKVQLQPK